MPKNPKPIEQRISTLLDERKKSGHLRQLTSLQGIDFCSNDYLSLAKKRTPYSKGSVVNGSTGSRLISGDNALTQAFEHQIAVHHGFEKTLLFCSGYSANSGLLAALGKKGDVFLMDELVHASLIDGARLSFAKRHRFLHNDISSLRNKLIKLQSHRKDGAQIFVVIESIYSMDGDHAPLQAISDICEDYGAALIVDEAHSMGIVGTNGEGCVAKLGLQKKVLATILTFGKAMGCHGAVIAGSTQLQDFLINFCRPFIYSTASSPHTVNILAVAHKKMIEANQAREQLTSVQKYFENRVKNLNLQRAIWSDSNSPIQALILKDANRAKLLESNLIEMGFAIKAILPPTVEKGSERLRICLHSHNTHDEIDQLASALIKILGTQK